MKTQLTLIILFTTILLFFVIGTLIAQAPGLPPTPGVAPIDGGLALLAAAGCGYAIKKLRERKE